MIQFIKPAISESPTLVCDKLEELRTQLVELAFTLDRRGQAEAADVAILTSARLAELCTELLGNAR
jgi:hypothetical protein